MSEVVGTIRSLLTAAEVHPRPGLVLLEAVQPTTSSLLFLPGVETRYPNMGFVVEAGPSLTDNSFAVNDLLLLKDEGRNTDFHTYYDAFAITLHDYKERVKIIVESDREPKFREVIAQYNASPSNDFPISVEDVENQGWTFNASDVEDFGFEEFAHPAWRMEYIPTYMIELNMGPGLPYKLHYIVDERKILGIVEVSGAG